MSGFPVRLEGLSRFQTDKEAREVVEGLADGTVDIVVGTHRLLNPDIRVKDLGLIIVDEEQRFGVEHKEQMKRLRTSVDVLVDVARRRSRAPWRWRSPASARCPRSPPRPRSGTRC